MVLRRKEEESMINAHGCAALASIADAVRHRSVDLSSVLWRLVAMMAVGVALCWVHLAGAQTPSTALVATYAGTLKKIAESGTVRIGHRENSPPFAFLD